jgi:hypothetical protein
LQFAQYSPARNRHFRDPNSPLFVCWQAGFTTWLNAWQPEVLIVEANPRYLATRPAISWMHRRHRKVIGWGLGAPVVSGPLAGLRNWERSSFLRTLDAIVAYSQLGAGQYRRLGFLPRKYMLPPTQLLQHLPARRLAGQFSRRNQPSFLSAGCKPVNAWTCY